jgi:hypothetical protein
MKNSLLASIKKHFLFICLLTGYVFLGIVNLDRLPIAWTDEIQHLDPVFNYFKYHHFYSKIWPNPGANELFASYPPLITNLHLTFLQFLPKTIFFTRLPFFFANILTLIILYQVLQQHAAWKSRPWIFALTLFFVLDKSVFEISKSMRVEPWIWLLLICGISALLNIEKPRNKILLSLISGLLLIAHIYVWPLVLFWILTAVFFTQNNTSIKYKTAQILIFLLPTIITYAWLNTPTKNIIHQLLFQSSKHASNENTYWQVFQYLWGKFWPYYIEQPLTPFIYLGVLIKSIMHVKQVKFSDKKSLIILSFLILVLPQALLLSPHIRYFGTHWLFVIVLISLWFNPDKLTKTVPFDRIKHGTSLFKLLKLVLISYVVLDVSSFLIRHSIAIYQRDDRNPAVAFRFLDKYIPSPYSGSHDKTVIFGEPIVEYYAVNRTDIEFGLAFYPEHWKFQPTNHKYLVFHKAKPIQLPFLTVIDSTGLPKNNLPKSLQKLGRAHTYRNIYLYQINSKAQWDSFFSPIIMEEINGK